MPPNLIWGQIVRRKRTCLLLPFSAAFQSLSKRRNADSEDCKAKRVSSLSRFTVYYNFLLIRFQCDRRGHIQHSHSHQVGEDFDIAAGGKHPCAPNYKINKSNREWRTATVLTRTPQIHIFGKSGRHLANFDPARPRLRHKN